MFLMFLKVFLVLLISAAPDKQASLTDLNDGLVAYYDFNGNANDASGYNNNPSFNNATLAAGRTGAPNTAYYFNGEDNYIRIPHHASLTPSLITLYAVVKPTGFYYGSCHGNSILQKGDDANLQSAYRMRFDDNLYASGGNCGTGIPDTVHQNYFGDFGGNGAFNTFGAFPPYVQKDRWACITFTFDGTTAKLYIDGILLRQRSTNLTYIANTQDLFIGRNNSSLFPYWFEGYMDEIRIYNRALSQQEVTSLCSVALPFTVKNFGGTLNNGSADLWWKTLDEEEITGYELQRSSDGRNFSAIATVPAKGKQQNDYNYSDAVNPGKTVYYRLQYEQKDGGKSYSAIVTLRPDRKDQTTLQLQPNPAKTYVQLNYTTTVSGSAEVRLIDMTGRIVHRQVESVGTGTNVIRINNIQQLTGGTYVVEVMQNGTSVKKRLVISH